MPLVYIYDVFIADNEIDGATLTGLTETMISELLPVMRYRVKLVKLLHDTEQPRPDGDPATSDNETGGLEPTDVNTETRYGN